MRAIKLRYPLPTTLPNHRSLQSLAETGRVVDFPERHLCYVIYDCNEVDVQQGILEVLKAVNSHPHGEEPSRLEIRSTQI